MFSCSIRVFNFFLSKATESTEYKKRIRGGLLESRSIQRASEHTSRTVGCEMPEVHTSLKVGSSSLSVCSEKDRLDSWREYMGREAGEPNCGIPVECMITRCGWSEAASCNDRTLLDLILWKMPKCFSVSSSPSCLMKLRRLNFFTSFLCVVV